MKKCELLSPAGNMEMLKYAIAYGADAVYLAGTKFGARKFANNFTNDEIIDAINYAHTYGVKVYITINTLIFENEIEEFMEYVEFIYKNNVDAVLIQDIGMLKIIHDRFPDLEIHASTQMHNNGQNIINFLNKLGAKRVVLDREISIDEIKKLSKNVEIEVFCHGALCASYSGQCLFSSLVMNRSGNRGECAGMCRLPYSRIVNNKNTKPEYLFSFKDLCTINIVGKLIDSGVNSLKIEGRMKSPQYVGYITKIYREAIDFYYEGKSKILTSEEMKNISLLFNREFTSGYIGNSSDQITNPKSPNHVGIIIGQYEVQKDKIKLTLSDDLHQWDQIRFVDDNKGMTVNFLYDSNDKLINSAKRDSIVFVDNFLELTKSGTLRKVSDFLLNKEIDNLPERKVPISANITICSNNPIELQMTDNINKITVCGSVPSNAINRPITKEDVTRQLMKTGDTVFKITKLNIQLEDNLFINLKDLNEIRRQATQLLLEERIKSRLKRIKKIDNNIFQPEFQSSVCYNFYIQNVKQYDLIKEVANVIIISDYNLYNTLKSDSKVIYKYPENPTQFNEHKYCISDLGSINLVKNSDVVYSDYLINIANSKSISYLQMMGLTHPYLSIELTDNMLENISNNIDCSNCEVMIYGKPKYMKVKENIISHDSQINYIIDRNNSKYIFTKQSNLFYLIGNAPINKFDNLNWYKQIGYKNFRIELLDETEEEIRDILDLL